MSTQIAKVDINFMNEVFAKIMGASPAFKQAFINTKILTEAKKIWLQVFIENDLNDWRKIQCGIINLASQTNPFVPTAGQFIAMCTPSAESLGLPSLQKAYEEACRLSKPYEKERSWSHEAVFHAAQETGLFFLSNNSKDKSFPVFKRNYEIVIDMLLNGEKLREIPKALEKKNFMTINGIQFEVHGRNAMSNIVNYQVAGGKLSFAEFERLFKAALEV